MHTAPAHPRRLAILSRGLLPDSSDRNPERRPTYLRVVVNAVCPLRCTFCHQEGDPAVAGRERGLSTRQLSDVLCAAVDAGVRKIKLLGGEPLLRHDLPDVVRAVRAHDADVDLSIITAGVVPADRLDALYEAGLTRCNVSIHGFSRDAFLARTGSTPRAWAQRNAFLEAAIAHGRPLKTNYVYTGPSDLADLGEFLAWAAPRRILVSVLDDLSNPALDAATLDSVLVALRGEPLSRFTEQDPHSLPTTRLVWADGLLVELKTTRLGETSPWRACDGCSEHTRCREGIHALRVSHTGELRPCMDRPDLAAALFGPDGTPLRPDLPRAIDTFIREHAR
jgi:molybdenum cofactor biosynthesis enzyme MoaA